MSSPFGNTTQQRKTEIILVFEIVKLTSTSFKDLKEFGIDLKKEGSLISLKEELETELYELSKAHFNRYFVEPIEKLNKN